MKWNQKGEGRGGAIFGIVVLATVVYLCFKIVPIAINVFAFEDEMKEECKYNGNKKPETLQDLIYRIGEKERLPIQPDDIQISKVANTLHVEVDYSVPIVFPGYTWNWGQHVVYDAPIF